MKIFTPTQPTLAFAAKELQAYLHKLTQTEFTLTSDISIADITLGITTDNEPLDHASFTQTNGHVAISGNRPVAALIAVYQYLHALGIRFLRPGSNGDFIPKASITVFQQSLAYDHIASYQHRGVCIEGADSVENIVDFIDWLPKNGFNSFFVQFANPYTFLKRWYEHENNHYLPKTPLTPATLTQMSAAVDDAIALRGLHHHRVGHGWTGEVLGFSSEFGWESGVKLPNDKKPLVAQVNGKRDLIGGTPIFTNLDMANPAAIKQLTTSIVTYSLAHPEVDYLHVWLSDGDNNVCECDDCQNTLPSDQYIAFLNQLDAQLTAANCDTKICFLLYHELLFAPQHEILHHPERFTMMFAPISRTFEKSYADVDYAHLPKAERYVRNQTTLPNSLEANLSFLFDWEKTFQGDSFVYDYPLGRAHYGDLGYMSIAKTISSDIRFLEQLHLHGYISCQELRAGMPTTFPNYVMGRTLWDKNTTFDDLKTEYFTAAFGPQAKQVSDYLTELSNLSSSDYFNAIGPRENPEFAKRFAQIVQLMHDFLPTIHDQLPQVHGVQRANWQLLAYHREAFKLLAQGLGAKASGNDTAAESWWQEFQDVIKRNEPHYQFALDVYRITEVATNYAGFTQHDGTQA